MNASSQEFVKIEMPTVYDPKAIEGKWYQWWKAGRFFEPAAAKDGLTYSLLMPPPNVTGSLHMGHGLTCTIQDLLARWKRMAGFSVLWLPGADHAGIATQAVVERHLWLDKGVRRADLDKESFLKLAWEWKDQYEQRIISQLEGLGVSCDWSRFAFTLDDIRSQAVRKAFKKLYDEDLIYRGDYLVNWDPVTKTALSDDELEYENRSTFLWEIRYPLVEYPDQFLVVSTTRPETLFGDTALAVHPSDHRYKQFIGKEVRIPLANRSVKVIADPFVEPEFGTGVVKITPAHDFSDFLVAGRHQLPMINLLTLDGKMNEVAGSFQGLSTQEARLAVASQLDVEGFLQSTTSYQNRVTVSYRSKATIEPLLSKQWFVRMDNFKKVLRDLVDSKQVQLIPSSWESTFFHWVDNLRDWCISRQLWWGHQIPIWYDRENSDRPICDDGNRFDKAGDLSGRWIQDPDVLDTWFSSALWPLSALGWPESTDDLEKFYPSSVLVTGHDILPFWVARMLFMGQFLAKKPPFPDVVLHGLIFGKSYWTMSGDGQISYVPEEERLAYELGKKELPAGVFSKWEKMSKSKGNVIDPTQMIALYGTDAMRLALCSNSIKARQIDLDRRKFEESRNFVNKLWNGARFVLSHTADLTLDDMVHAPLGEYPLEDRWILGALSKLIIDVDQALVDYEVDQALAKLYHFFWNDFCASYIEIIKPTLQRGLDLIAKKNKQRMAILVLFAFIRLLHPFAPFVTEELFSLIKRRWGAVSIDVKIGDALGEDFVKSCAAPGCIVAPFPSNNIFPKSDQDISDRFAFLQGFLNVIRVARAAQKLAPKDAIDLFVVASAKDLPSWLPQSEALLKAQTAIGVLEWVSDPIQIEQFIQDSDGYQVSCFGGLQLFVPQSPALLASELMDLQKEVVKLSEKIKYAVSQLANASFCAKAPVALVKKLEEERIKSELALDVVRVRLRKIAPLVKTADPHSRLS